MAAQRSLDEAFMGHAGFPEARILRNSSVEDRRFVDNTVDFPVAWLEKMLRSMHKNNGIALVGHIHNARLADYLWALSSPKAPKNS
ncbi:MAG: hypothetical protein G8345_05775 [Magnetococcales bacterium]|nr:hypothetical protein [Magnetococcales bacterium]NGZ26378.1 hypothetical protein [Magnetococcales bacterium]